MKAKTFPLGVLLSLTTGRLLCEFSDMHACAEFLMDSPIWTHQFADRDLSARLKAIIVQQHPGLASVNASRVTTVNWPKFLAKQVARFGEQLSVMPSQGEDAVLAKSFSEPLQGKAVVVVVEAAKGRP